MSAYIWGVYVRSVFFTGMNHLWLVRYIRFHHGHWLGLSTWTSAFAHKLQQHRNPTHDKRVPLILSLKSIRILSCQENRYLAKCNILKYRVFVLSGVVMNASLRQVLRYTGVPVDAAEPVRRKFGSRLILIVTVALLPLLIVDISQCIFVLSQLMWGIGMYVGISVASDKPERR